MIAKKGAANYAGDFAVGSFIFVIFITTLFMFSSCVDGRKEEAVKAPKHRIARTQEIITLMQWPVEYNGVRMSVADLTVRAYHNPQERGNIKQTLQYAIDDYAHVAGKPVYKDELCWMYFTKAGSDKFLDLWGECRGQPSVRTNCWQANMTIPLDPDAKEPLITVYYSNMLNKCFNGQYD